MDIDFYHTVIDAPAIGICIAAGYLLHRTFRHYSTLLVTAGFSLVLVGFISNNYCVGISQISDYILDYPYLCHPTTSYIRGAGYLLIGFGLIKLNEYLKSA